jgi:hypothetical protein
MGPLVAKGAAPFFRMPINEFRGSRSGLTAKQKREQEQAVYGLGGTTMANKDISPEELERMRAIVAEHDPSPKQTAVLDINNPPREPYVYQPFPKVVYKAKEHKDAKAPKEWENKVVRDEKELKEAVGKGWKPEPPNPEDAPEVAEHEHEKPPAPPKK